MAQPPNFFGVEAAQSCGQRFSILQDFSRFSEGVNHIIDYRCLNPNILHDCALRNIVLKMLDVNSESFQDAPFYTQSWYYRYHLNLFTCGMIQAGCMYMLKHVDGIKFRMSVYLQKSLKCVSLRSLRPCMFNICVAWILLCSPVLYNNNSITFNLWSAV